MLIELVEQNVCRKSIPIQMRIKMLSSCLRIIAHAHGHAHNTIYFDNRFDSSAIASIIEGKKRLIILL